MPETQHLFGPKPEI